MAKYYGILKGGRGEATRTGTANSGINSEISSWVSKTTTRYFEEKGVTMVSIVVSGKNGGNARTVFYGTEAELMKPKGV